MSAPDWGLWLSMRAVQVWQACALSLDMDPARIHMDPDGWMVLDAPYRMIRMPLQPGTFPPESQEAVFDKRLRLLSSHVDDPSHFQVVPGDHAGIERKIMLQEFANWVVNVAHWEGLPPELAGIAQTSKTANSVIRPLPLQRAQELEILRSITELGYQPKALPKAQHGKPGIKAEVRAKLTYSPNVYEKAWERLRSNGEIQDAT
jgi:hypothetical protein